MKLIALLIIAAGFVVMFWNMATGIGTMGSDGMLTISMMGMSIVIVGTGLFVSAAREAK